MALIVENGSIVANANSYVSEAEITAYATARGVTLIKTAEQLGILSMDYIETQSYQGAKSTADQSLQWPRTGVVIDGYAIESNDIPQELKNAQLATCLAVDAGNAPDAIIDRAVKREKVDVLETEYMDSAVSTPIDPKINNHLKKLLANSGGMFNPIVTRG